MTKPRQKRIADLSATTQTPMSSRQGRKMKKLLILLGLMLLALLGCASNPPTLMPPLPKPIVSCGEHEPFEPLGIYPSAPVGLGFGVDPPNYLSAIAQLRLAKQYIGEQSQWAIGAAGIFQRDAIKRRGTAACLDELRRRGIIQ
jgi:hypothetical protein